MFFCNFDRLPHLDVGKSANVVLFGESCYGNSSTVNLLLGKNVAPTGDLAVASTFGFQVYETPNYTLYDTVGLSGDSQDAIHQPATIAQLISLLKRLEDGVSLLIFVMERGNITKTHVENYKLFVDEICLRKVPVILMINHSKLDPNPDKWWQENKCFFNKYKMHFDAVVSGCSTFPETTNAQIQPIIKALNGTTASKLREAINAKILVPGWKFKGGWMDWLQTIISTVLPRLSVWFRVPFSRFFPCGQDTFEQRLYTYFNNMTCDQIVAKQLANSIANYRKPTEEISCREDAELDEQRNSVNVRC